MFQTFNFSNNAKFKKLVKIQGKDMFLTNWTRSQSNMIYFKTCNRILNLDHGDVTAFHCKIVAMIHTGKFQDALKQGKKTFLDFVYYVL